jgi:hypothetical protein
MKLQAPVISAFFPAALAVASISLAILVLPGGGAPARSSGIAPALKLAAGDVVAAVEVPVRAVTSVRRKTAVPHETPADPVTRVVALTPPTTHSHLSSRAVRAPTAGKPVHHVRASRTRVTTSAPAKHDNGGKGEGKAVGHVRKLAASPVPANAVEHPGQAKGHGVEARGRPADAPHGPPAVPPGHARVRSADRQALPGRRGGRE